MEPQPLEIFNDFELICFSNLEHFMGKNAPN